MGMSNMKREEWQAALDGFPPGLTLHEVAKRIGCSYRLAAAWVKILGYKYKNGNPDKWTKERRLRVHKVEWAKLPWGCTNAQIARAYGVSREIVRKRRKEYGQ